MAATAAVVFSPQIVPQPSMRGPRAAPQPAAPPRLIPPRPTDAPCHDGEILHVRHSRLTPWSARRGWPRGSYTATCLWVARQGDRSSDLHLQRLDMTHECLAWGSFRLAARDPAASKRQEGGVGRDPIAKSRRGHVPQQPAYQLRARRRASRALLSPPPPHCSSGKESSLSAAVSCSKASTIHTSTAHFCVRPAVRDLYVVVHGC